MEAWRIADARHPIFDGTGALLHGGRWNSAGRPVIYAAASYAGAMLEVLVHANLSLPPRNQRLVHLEIPDEIEVERVAASAVRGWDAEDVTPARAFGDRWLGEARTAVLRVPGVVTGGREDNVLINPLHRQSALIQAGQPEEVRWDGRLFARRL